MPCAAINNIDDRDYIKSLKKNVLVGNDGEEKACLCQCKVPTTSEGCPILDENNKVGLFPFCIPLVSLSSVGTNTAYPVKMKLNQVMDLFWAKNIILGVLGYLLAPLDFLPDLAPIIGFTDDIGILTVGLVTIASYVNDDVRTKARTKIGQWFPDYNKEEIIETVS